MAGRIPLQAGVNHGPSCTDLSGSSTCFPNLAPRKPPPVLLTSLILQEIQPEGAL